jgi:hypothetical protein
MRDFELTQVDGKRTYDILLGLLDPRLVKFQFQCSTISQGYDAAEYFMKYPGRFHLDARAGLDPYDQENRGRGTGLARLEEDLSPLRKQAALKNYFVEMNLDLMKASVPYLRDLHVT